MPIISKKEAKRRGYSSHGIIQTILIPREFTKKDAELWLDQNGYKRDSYRLTHHFRRFMQVNPVKKADYATHTLPNGVELVFMNIK